MAWTTPNDRTTGFLVTAAVYNTEIVDNLAYLHGDAGTISLAALLHDLSGFTTGPSSATFSGSQTHGVFADGTGQVASFCNAAVNAFSAGAIGDSVPRWTVDSNGITQWGLGGSSALDLSISRAAAGQLKIGSSVTGKGNLKAGFVANAPGLPATITPDAATLVTRIAPINNNGALTIGAPVNPPGVNETAFLVIILKAPAAGLSTITWNSAFAGGTTPSLSANAGEVLLFVWDDGTSKWQIVSTNAE